MAVPTNKLTLEQNLINLSKALYAHKSNAVGHSLASQSKAGFMSPLDKAKLDSLGNDVKDGSITSAKLASVIDLGKVSE